MTSYYCIVNLPGLPAREIAALAAVDDGAARAGLADVAARWPGFETIALYEGERLMTVLANPACGFPPDGIKSRAADPCALAA